MSRVSDLKGDDPSPFHVYSREELDTLKEPEPLIEGRLTKGCVALLFGAYGTGKSFLALDWAAHLASGLDWHGHVVAQEYRVLYVAAEGAGGLKNRLRAWEMEYTDDEPIEIDVVRVAVRFGNDDDHFIYLGELIKERGYDFIVIDTLSRNTPGMDENGPDMTVFIERVFELRDVAGIEKTAFLIVHHAGKDKGRGPRGWTGIPAATDFCYSMEKEDEGLFTLKTDRVKDMDPPKDMTFALNTKHHWTNDKGYGQQSCTLELSEETAGSSALREMMSGPTPNASDATNKTVDAAIAEMSDSELNRLAGGKRKVKRTWGR